MQDRTFIPTGSEIIESVIGRDGIPESVITTIVGNADTGKTTTVTHLAKEVIAAGGGVTVIDAENAWNKDWVEAIGLDPDKVEMLTPDELIEVTEGEKKTKKAVQRWTTERVFEKLFEICKKRKATDTPYLVIWDTFSQTPTNSEALNPFGKAVGEHARIVSAALRTLTGALSRGRVTLVVVLQPRDIIGAIGIGKFKPTAYLAYREWYHASLLQLDLSRAGTVQLGSGEMGTKIRVKARKNKVGKPHGEAEFEILGKGIDSGRSQRDAMLSLAMLNGLVVKAGRKMQYKDRVFGKPEWRDVLDSNPELAKELANVEMPPQAEAPSETEVEE